MKRFTTLIILLLAINYTVNSQVVYNSYAKVTSISGQTVNVSNPIEPTSYSFAVGEQVLVMQMQDNVIGTNTTNVNSFGNLSAIQSAGLWEIKTIAGLTRAAGVLQAVAFTSALINSYNTGANSSLQIVTFKRLSAAAFTTTNNITATAWDGNRGGVVAIEVGTDLNLNHNISANGLGFRLGSLSNNDGGGCTSGIFISNSNNYGGKGEGVYKNTNANFNTAQAKMLNGGGGGINHNGGGGGGGNWTAGGNGGPGWNNTAAGCNPGAGGQGGISLASVTTSNRIFMGGGGGGAQQNNSLGSAGGNGGGIVIVKADRLITSGSCSPARSISANGNNGPNTSGGNNDGAGGGGAAGTVVLQINTFSVVSTCSLQVQSNGGNGGSSPFGATHAGGGAGGQGIVVYSAAMPTVNVSTTTNNGSPGCNDNSVPCNNSAGAATGTNNAGVFTSIGGVLPIELINFTAKKQGNHVLITWTTSSEMNNDYFEVEKSTDAFNFTAIEKVKTKAKNGNSNKPLSYETKDLSKRSGIVYYRLKQTDLNTNYKYHSIVSVDEEIEKVVRISVYPNPNNGQFTADLFGIENEQEIELNLSDMKGKLIYKNTVKINAGSNSFQIVPKEQLEAGIYLFNIKLGGVAYPVKLIVQ